MLGFTPGEGRMPKSFGPLLIIHFFLIAGAGEALAQTSAFAGTWSGTATFTTSNTCTCTGMCSGYTPTPFSCTGTQSWSGTIDQQGNATWASGAGTETCSDGTSIPLAASPASAAGQLSSNGTLTFPPYANSTSH